MGRRKKMSKARTQEATVTHVLILSPTQGFPFEAYEKTRKHIGKLYRLDRLPSGFKIKGGALGVWLLYTYKGEEYAWGKLLFGKVNGKWYNFTFKKFETPTEQITTKTDFQDPLKIKLGFKKHMIEHQIKPLHRKRSPHAQVTDEGLRAKEAPTKYHWMRAPQRFDVKGVDTPQPRAKPLTSSDLLFRVWVEQRGFRRAKPKGKWTEADKKFMKMTFQEFKVQREKGT